MAHVTVVVPTYRRPDGLARVLTALASQEEPGVPWDVVVVDNDGAPETRTVFDAHKDALPVTATLIHEPESGATRARNTGIDKASGDIIAFVDDDVTPDGSWLKELVAPITTGEGDASGGRVELDPTVTLPRWLGDDWLGYLSQYDRGPRRRILDHGDYVLTANAAFRTDGLRAIGGFDEALGPRAGSPMVNDDLDLCRRFVADGNTIVYVPDAVVVHDVPADRVTARYLLRRAYAQGRSDWLIDRQRNAQRPLGGAQGMLVHVGRLLGDRVREGPWHPEVAMGAALAFSQAGGFLREAAVQKLRPHRATAP